MPTASLSGRRKPSALYTVRPGRTMRTADASPIDGPDRTVPDASDGVRAEILIRRPLSARTFRLCDRTGRGARTSPVHRTADRTADRTAARTVDRTAVRTAGVGRQPSDGNHRTATIGRCVPSNPRRFSIVLSFVVSLLSLLPPPTQRLGSTLYTHFKNPRGLRGLF
jgi:hypothetical protein